VTTLSGRAAHRPSRRQHILDAAVRVFGSEGVVNTSVADVAAACGLVPAGVYYHFETKEAVLAAVMETIGQEIVAAMRPVEPIGPPAEDLAERVRTVFRWSQAHPDKARVFYLWSVAASPEIESIRRRFVEGRIEAAARYLPARTRSAQEAVTRRLAARAAIELGMATSVAWLSGDVFDPSTDADDVADALAAAMQRILGL